jgi:hypothetical protein
VGIERDRIIRQRSEHKWVRGGVWERREAEDMQRALGSEDEEADVVGVGETAPGRQRRDWTEAGARGKGEDVRGTGVFEGGDEGLGCKLVRLRCGKRVEVGEAFVNGQVSLRVGHDQLGFALQVIVHVRNSNA